MLFSHLSFTQHCWPRWYNETRGDFPQAGWPLLTCSASKKKAFIWCTHQATKTCCVAVVCAHIPRCCCTLTLHAGSWHSACNVRGWWEGPRFAHRKIKLRNYLKVPSKDSPCHANPRSHDGYSLIFINLRFQLFICFVGTNQMTWRSTSCFLMELK